MANGGGYFKQLKGLVADFTENGEILKEPRGNTAKKGLNKDSKEFLTQFVDLLLTSRMLCDETKEYIKNPFITYAGVSDILSARDGREYNANTVQTKMWNDKNKVIKFFGERMLIQLIEYRDTSGLTEYKKSLEQAWNKYSKAKVLDSIALKLPTIEGEVDTENGRELFQEFIGVIAPYTKKHMQFISSNVSIDAVAYCRQILSRTCASDEDRKNKELLEELLS